MASLRSILATIFLRDAPFWGASRKRRLARLLTFALYLYVGHALLLVALQDRFAFPGWTFDRHWESPPPNVPTEEIDLDTAVGDRVRVWWMVPDGWTPRQGAVLFAHGNGRNLSHAGGNLRRWRDNLSMAVLGIEYPGYGPSTGQPNETSCYAAGDAALDWLVQVKNVRAKDIVLVGESMGGSIVFDLAAKQPCRMVVTMGAYTSYPDIAQKHIYWLPTRYLVSMQFDNLTKIATTQTPVFIAHGMLDDVVPFSHGERLFEAAQEPKRFFPMPDHPHMHPRRPAFFDAVRQFLAETRPD